VYYPNRSICKFSPVAVRLDAASLIHTVRHLLAFLESCGYAIVIVCWFHLTSCPSILYAVQHIPAAASILASSRSSLILSLKSWCTQLLLLVMLHTPVESLSILYDIGYYSLLLETFSYYDPQHRLLISYAAHLTWLSLIWFYFTCIPQWFLSFRILLNPLHYKNIKIRITIK